MQLETPKGFRDFTGLDAQKREQIRNILIGTFRKYGFEPAETPIIEFREFVEGENKQDEAVSDIFRLKDRGERDLALRYEFTFQLKRLMQAKKLPYKRYQIGSVFRDEPTSGNRMRQFTQCDIDVVSSSFRDEAEILAITSSILSKLGIKFTIFINNRKLLNEILEKENIPSESFLDVIKEIDKLDKLPEQEIIKNLKKFRAENLLSIFKNPESFFERYENYKEIKELKEYCGYYGIKVKFLPSLARGLSYYNGSVFEVKSEIKESITGGGSYIFNGVQCTGISFGLDRLSSLANLALESKTLLIISIQQDKRAVEIAESLREKEIPCILSYGKISKSLEFANAKNIPYVFFLGDEEVKKKLVKLRDMKTGKEVLFSLAKAIKKIKG